MIKIGSLFAGIGGFERGIEAAIKGAETIWQVEREPFCQKVLKKHWPNSKIYNDVRDITKENVEPVDMLIGGFPCQDISWAGKGKGLDGKKSGLWWEMHRIIRELRPRVVVMENVAALLIRGGLDVLGSLAEIGYDAEWRIIAARDFGAPHRRDRWFCVAWPSSNSDGFGSVQAFDRGTCSIGREGEEIHGRRSPVQKTPNSDRASFERIGVSLGIQKKDAKLIGSIDTRKGEINYWERHSSPSPFCRVDDGVSNRLHRLKALGNAIVPQCSEYVGRMILKSGLLS